MEALQLTIEQPVIYSTDRQGNTYEVWANTHTNCNKQGIHKHKVKQTVPEVRQYLLGIGRRSANVVSTVCDGNIRTTIIEQPNTPLTTTIPPIGVTV